MKNKYFVFLSLVGVLLILGFVAYLEFGNWGKSINQLDNQASSTPLVIPPVVACMEEAMQCPDGSYVGRVGPNCDFEACPIVSTTTDLVACTMEAKQCPDGSYVGRQGPKCEFAPCPTSSVKNDCAVGGCSGTLCGEPGEDLISTCEYKEEYQCYKQAVCERQATGKCGWTQTDEFAACLVKYKK